MTDSVYTPRESEQPVFELINRIDSTTYQVEIRFSENATESFEDKVLKLVDNEVQANLHSFRQPQN
jgi:hypothetical protein